MKRKSLALILLLILLLAQAMPVLAVDVPAVSDPVTDFTPLDTTAPAEIFTTEVGAAVSHFYAYIGAGPKVFHPLMSKLMWVQTF